MTGAALAIAGSLQLWQKTCDASGACGLPQPLGARLPVAGQVEPPTAAGQLDVFKTTATAASPAGDVAVELQVFYVAPPDGSAPYLVAQAKLTRTLAGAAAAGGLAECSQYASVPAAGAAYFPVGACAGFAGDAELGVAFYRQ